MCYCYCYLITPENTVRKLREVLGYVRPGEHVSVLSDKKRKARLLKLERDLRRCGDLSELREVRLVTCKDFYRFQQDPESIRYTSKSWR